MIAWGYRCTSVQLQRRQLEIYMLAFGGATIEGTMICKWKSEPSKLEAG